jgi:hypothetical protein
VTDRAARRAGVQPVWSVELVRTARPGEVSVVPAALATLSVGSVRREQTEVIVGGSAIADLAMLDPTLDGILGQSFLSAVSDYTLDYARGMLALEAGASGMGRSGTSYALTTVDGRPGVELCVEGRRGVWVIDSGAPRNIRVGGKGGLLATSAYRAVHIDNRRGLVVLSRR